MMGILHLCVLLVLAVLSQGDQSINGCKVSVVGAGWGGTYFAYRVSVPSATKVFDAEDVCVFEQDPTHVGGRARSFGNPAWEDLTVELGAYRYPTSGMDIVKGIVENILDLDTVCYNGPCSNTEGYRVISDPYGNNGGYYKGPKGLLQKFQNKGGNVYMGHRLVNVQKGQGGKPIKLVFKNQQNQTVTVNTKKAFLNLHTSAINTLDTAGNLLYTKSTNYSLAALKSASDIPTIKQFVWYEDAWWLTKLNLTEGGMYSDTPLLPAIADLRWGDGSVKCYKNTNAGRQYYDHRVAGGVDGSKCYGSIMNAYVSFDDTTYNYYLDNWVTAQEKANKVQAIFIKQGDSRQQLLADTHASMLTAHASLLAAAGIDPNTIAPPTSTVLGIYNSQYNPLEPSYFVNIFDVQANQNTPDASRQLNNLAAKPTDKYDIYVASEAYGLNFGWAEGSLIMVERILAEYFDQGKPSYVSNVYWNNLVLPYLTLPDVNQCNSNSDCATDNNCVVGKCKGHSCFYETRVNEPCNQGDLCNQPTTCSYSALCYGPAKVCNGTDVCIDGTCVAGFNPPATPCHYHNDIGPFDLAWGFAGDKINMVYSLPGNGYYGFGIGSSMQNADIIIGFTQADGSIHVKDYWSANPGAPKLDTDIGGTSDISNVWVGSGCWGCPASTYFTRKLNTGDSKDNVIVNGTMNFIYAWVTEGIQGQIVYHQGNRNHITVDLSVCNP